MLLRNSLSSSTKRITTTSRPTSRTKTIRTFSLWPSSSTTTPPSPPPSNLTPLPPSKPLLSDIIPPATSLPVSTYLEPLSTLFLSLPPSFNLSYAIFIPLFTWFYRSSTTLPVVMWQRRRTRRFGEMVVPRLKEVQKGIAVETRDQCRRAGKSYQEYQKVFQKKAKQAAYQLARRYNCSPRLTLILPPLFHIPIFITATLTLRDACTRALSTLNIDESTLSKLSTLDGGQQQSLLTLEALSHLHELSSTTLLWCPSLILPDPTMLLPLGVGLLALLNVEVQAKNRERAIDPVSSTTTNDRGGGDGREGKMGVVSASEKRRILARRARSGQVVINRGISTSVPTRSTSVSSRPEEQSVSIGGGISKPNTAKIVTNVLRFASVAFIPVAGLAPSAVCLYWIASNLFTLVQNLTFNSIDRKREKDKRMREILLGRT